MFNYIGIRGHRGAGKNTVSYLLGAAIEYYIKNRTWSGFRQVYNKAVARVLEDENFIEESEFKHVYFESFADTAKTMLYQVTGIPLHYMYDDWCKDSIIFNVKDFSFKQAANKMDLAVMVKRNTILKAEELAELVEKENITTCNHDIFISLRELISYFSKFVMQKSFGKDVWVKSLFVNKLDHDNFYSANRKNMFKIFIDCKFSTEITYILQNSGKIIKVNRLDNNKGDTNISEELKNDNRYDCDINITEDLLSENTYNQIIQTTSKILTKND